MRSNNSGCLTAFISSFSRIMLLFAWIARPVMMNEAFGTFIIPCLGFLFLPFTTLMYVILIQGVGTIQGLDWLWLGLAVLLDVASIAGAGAANRNRIPAGYPGSYRRMSWRLPRLLNRVQWHSPHRLHRLHRPHQPHRPPGRSGYTRQAGGMKHR